MDISYYKKNGVQVIDVIDAWNLNFNRGCVIKYILRAGSKPGEEELKDLRKALDYLNHEVDRLAHGD